MGFHLSSLAIATELGSILNVGNSVCVLISEMKGPENSWRIYCVSCAVQYSCSVCSTGHSKHDPSELFTAHCRLYTAHYTLHTAHITQHIEDIKLHTDY